MADGFNQDVLFWCVLFLSLCYVEIYGKTKKESGDFIQPRLNILKKKYLKNADETWDLVADTGHWALVFHYLSIENSSHCQCDYLEIHETASVDDSPHLAPTRYCGEITPLPYISHTPRLTLHFVSDSLWELKGFNITAIHGEHRETLEAKVYGMANTYTVTQALEAENLQENDYSDKGTIFYVLVGSSSASLILFVILLAYFVIVMRKQIHTHKTRVPVLYYITGSNQIQGSSLSREPFVKLKSSTSTLQTAQELCNTGKRRYSKDKKAGKRNIGESTSVKFVEPNCRAQHNNLYVSNASVHVCRN